MSTIFFEISFLRLSRVLYRVMGSSKIVLQINLNTFCSKIKIKKTMTLESFQNYLENLIFESSKISV